MIKKAIRIFLISILFFSASPFINASAAATNITTGKPFVYYSNGSLTSTNYMNMTDGSTSTYAQILSTKVYSMVFPEDYHLTSYQTVTNTTTALGYIRIHFYSDVNMTQLVATNLYGKSGQTAINYNKVRAVKITSPTNSGGYYLQEFRLWGEPSQIIHEEIQEPTFQSTPDSITLNWLNPANNLDFTGIKIYRNNELLTSLDNTQTSYTDSNLTADTNYNYRIAATYSDGFETTGESVAAKTAAPPKPPGEVKQLQAIPSYNKVNLSWNLPTDENFQMVRIYRDQVETAFLGGLFGSTAYAAETPIFETNGTYFNDLSVVPSTKYEYTLTTVSSEGLESDGITTQVTTTKEPAPEMSGISYIDENGNLIYTWTKPTTGTVKVLVDGVEYATVPGSDGTITIPKNEVPTNIMGEPKVTFQAIGEYGTPGQVQSASIKVIETPFGAIDLVQSGIALLSLIAPFLLLALSFLFYPRLKRLLFQSLGKREKKENQEKERRSTQDEPKEKHEGKEHLEKKERIERAEKERRERETRERLERDRERASKEIKTIQEKETKERIREPKERRERTLRAFGRVREPRQQRAPRERTREPRPTREPRERRR